MILKRILTYIYYLSIISLLSIFALDYWVSHSTSDNIYEDYDELPTTKIGVVLGTSKYIKTGGINGFYKSRIDGAVELYQKYKISYLLLSGDNALLSYNEPIMMRRDLLKANIPDNAIVLDYAGFRTLDSIVRANRVFSANNFTIITQRFHCERALFIAKHQGINAQCFAVPSPKKMKLVRIREVFARLKAIADLYLFHQKPKFLGPAIPIIHEIIDNNLTDDDLTNSH